MSDCAQCGGAMPPPNAKGKPRTYCSRRCTNKAWSLKRALSSPDQTKCRHCSSLLPDGRRWYCDGLCSHRARVGDSKSCRSCGVSKPLDAFYGGRTLAPDCKQCDLMGRRAARVGVSVDEVRAIVSRLACDACGIWLQSGELHVDHDHVTGKLRGALCGPCNWALGFARESPQRLRALAVYVERSAVAA